MKACNVAYLGIVACLLSSSTLAGNIPLNEQWKCYSGPNCQGRQIFGASTCSFCTPSNPCQSCCSSSNKRKVQICPPILPPSINQSRQQRPIFR